MEECATDIEKRLLSIESGPQVVIINQSENYCT